jgi:hypothetical protein
MWGPSRFRFTLGQLMAFIAVSAVFLAAATYSIAGNHNFLIALSYFISFALFGVLLYNIRLSGWMWVAIVGEIGRPLFFIAVSLGATTWPGAVSGTMLVTVHLFVNNVFSLVFIVGLAMTFRDVRRRLTSREDEP